MCLAPPKNRAGLVIVFDEVVRLRHRVRRIRPNGRIEYVCVSRWPKASMKRGLSYFTIRGGSRKKIAKKIIPKVPTRRKVYTSASIKFFFNFFFLTGSFDEVELAEMW